MPQNMIAPNQGKAKYTFSTNLIYFDWGGGGGRGGGGGGGGGRGGGRGLKYCVQKSNQMS